MVQIPDTFDPSLAVAVMMAVPTALAVTLPLVSTVATEVLLLLHFTPLLFALLGYTYAVKVTVLPTVME